MTAPEEWVTTISLRGLPPVGCRWTLQVIVREGGGKRRKGKGEHGGELVLYVDFLHGLLLTGTSPHGEVERLAQSS